MTFTGDRLKYEIALNEREHVVAVVPNLGETAGIAAGGLVEVGWRAEDAVAFPAD